MAKNDLLELDVAILVLRYGEKAVVGQLAAGLQLSEEQVLERISSMKSPRTTHSKTKKKIVFSVEKLAEEHAHLAPQLLELDAKYENRTFLSELRDVNRFLEKTGSSVTRLKSRQEAKRKVFQALAKMTSSQLDSLREEAVSQARGSSLGVISDQILGRSKK